ncbi:MAG: penicillin-binding protein 2 [Crocinitomicaceae bacterium]
MKNTDNRKYIIALFFVLVSLIFIVRLFYMQVVDDKWKERAAQISENKITTYPARGIVYDRNGKKLIANEVYYDIHVIPNQTDNPDSVALAKLLDISLEEYTKQMNKARDYSKRKPSELARQIPPDEFSGIALELYKYPGFYEVERTLRIYPKSIGSHVLGYMAEVDSSDIKKDAYYKSGDLIGKSGIERSYEEVLRGKKGVKYYLQDAIGLETARYEEGKYDTVAVQGKDISLTIDADLQEYGERLMQNKRGAIVAIEPKSGEILTMISSPSYDPNMLVGRRLGKNYSKLEEDTLVPLYNRATNARYNPGSTFKLLMALIGLQEEVITENTSLPCRKELLGCHNHPTARSVSDAVKMSCNPYFYVVTRKIIQQGKYKSHFKDAAVGLDIWADYLHSFGLGVGLHTDFPSVSTGVIPTTEFYNKEFPTKTNPYGEYAWAFSTIYSNSIGQGEVELTPVELANVAVVMANRGWYYYPHFIKEIQDAEIPEIYKKKQQAKVSPENFEPVVEGMWRVVHESGGTARRAKVDSLDICGKTGTTENFKTYDGRRRQLKDHSIFIAFAPKDDPKIAISVYIENAGFGGTWAAPIASLMIEKYINGEISDSRKEQRILDANLLPIEIVK